MGPMMILRRTKTSSFQPIDSFIQFPVTRLFLGTLTQVVIDSLFSSLFFKMMWERCLSCIEDPQRESSSLKKPNSQLSLPAEGTAHTYSCPPSVLISVPFSVLEDFFPCVWTWLCLLTFLIYILSLMGVCLDTSKHQFTTSSWWVLMGFSFNFFFLIQAV